MFGKRTNDPGVQRKVVQAPAPAAVAAAPPAQAGAEEDES